jgi:hypothetical protein
MLLPLRFHLGVESLAFLVVVACSSGGRSSGPIGLGPQFASTGKPCWERVCNSGGRLSGLNPRVRLPEGSGFGSFLPEGGVTLAFGNNTWAGGENDVTWGDARFLQGATVLVDGEPLVQDGRLTP